MRAGIAAPCLAAVLMACGPGGGADTTDDTAGSPEAGATMVRQGPIRIAGVLMVGEATAEFLPCDGSEPLWLDGPLTSDVVALHDDLTPGTEPFEGIFLDVVADIVPPPTVGPGADYRASLLVDDVRRAAYEGWNCGDVDPDLVVAAAGTEPFWSLRVNSSGAEFATPEGRRSFDLGDLEPGPAGWRMEGVDPVSGPVHVSLRPEPCRNAMSGAFSHLTVEVVVGDTTLRGCGWFGTRSDPDTA